MKRQYIFPNLTFESYDEPVNRPLCDGLAAYRKVLDYEVVWGFRDANGKEVVPARYTVKPGSFNSGYYMNRQGEIVIEFLENEF